MISDLSHFTSLIFAGTLRAPTYLIITGIMLKGCKTKLMQMKEQKVVPF